MSLKNLVALALCLALCLAQSAEEPTTAPSTGLDWVGLAVIIVFYYMNDDSAINAVYRLAAYTYGPILGLFAFGLVCRWPVRDAWVSVVVVTAPLLCYVLQTHSEQWLDGYRIGFELIILNAVVTMMGMMMMKDLTLYLI